MRLPPFPRSWPLAGLLVFTGACSIFTNLSELTGGTTSASASGTGGAASSSGTGGAPTGSASSSSGSGAGSPDAGCNGPYEFEDQDTFHCYYYPMPAYDHYGAAIAKCAAWDPSAYPVVIENQDEAFFLMNHLQPDTWLGLTDLTSPGVYRWANGTLPVYADWDTADHYPNDAGGADCVMYAPTLKWQNISCTADLATLCERP